MNRATSLLQPALLPIGPAISSSYWSSHILFPLVQPFLPTFLGTQSLLLSSLEVKQLLVSIPESLVAESWLSCGHVLLATEPELTCRSHIRRGWCRDPRKAGCGARRPLRRSWRGGSTWRLYPILDTRISFFFVLRHAQGNPPGF